MRTGLAATLAVVLILTAGCAAEPRADASPDPGLPPANLEPGRFYSFHHGGGPLVFALDGDGDVSLELYGGDDTRLGSVGFSSSPTSSGMYRLEGVDAGELVLHMQTLNGTLSVDADGARVTRFLPLVEHVERVLLVQHEPRLQPFGALNIEGLPTAEPVHVAPEVAFQRAPSHLRVLGTGPWSSDLVVQVEGARGVVLRTLDNPSSPSTLSLAPTHDLIEVPSTMTPQNLRDGALTVHVDAGDLGGALVLEARSFARAPLPTPGARGPDPADVAFTYGDLPDGPVGFTVHRSARHLVLWQGDGSGPANGTDAAVALFDGHDAKLGVVLVPPRGSVEVPVAADGTYVAVLLSGQATLGADRAPADFELRPLGVQEATVPSVPAGQGGDYGVATVELSGERVFALRNSTMAAPTGDFAGQAMGSGGCDTGRFIALAQGGETRFAFFEPGQADVDPAPFLQGSLALDGGPIVVTHDGFGDDGCSRAAVAVLAYER